VFFKIRINLARTAPNKNMLSFICISIFLPMDNFDTTL
jgi:hypothetical protein